MSDETTKIVKTASDGTVTIAVEKYHELLEKAAIKPPMTVTTIQKTPEMVAKDHCVTGATLMAVGVSLLVVGAVRLKLGLSATKALQISTK